MLRVATRGSALARWQAEAVAGRLRAARPDLIVELVVTETAGDRHQDVPVWELGGQGVFVKEVQQAVLDGRADLAVHSAKDLPSTATPGLVIAAYPERGDPRDALVGVRLAVLAEGATVATGSVRRRAQLAAVRADLRFTSVRGNIATRLGKVPVGGALVVAAAALHRLGLYGVAAEVLEPAVMLPQVAQGALAVECRDGDAATTAALAAIDDPLVRVTVEAERAFLSRLGGGCDLPVGAHATLERGGDLTVEGLIASLDGTVVVRGRRQGRGRDGEETGRALAGELLGRADGVGLLGTLGR